MSWCKRFRQSSYSIASASYCSYLGWILFIMVTSGNPVGCTWLTTNWLKPIILQILYLNVSCSQSCAEPDCFSSGGRRVQYGECKMMSVFLFVSYSKFTRAFQCNVVNGHDITSLSAIWRQARAWMDACSSVATIASWSIELGAPNSLEQDVWTQHRRAWLDSTVNIYWMQYWPKKHSVLWSQPVLVFSTSGSIFLCVSQRQAASKQQSPLSPRTDGLRSQTCCVYQKGVVLG